MYLSYNVLFSSDILICIDIETRDIIIPIIWFMVTIAVCIYFAICFKPSRERSIANICMIMKINIAASFLYITSQTTAFDSNDGLGRIMWLSWTVPDINRQFKYGAWPYHFQLQFTDPLQAEDPTLAEIYQFKRASVATRGRRCRHHAEIYRFKRPWIAIGGRPIYTRHYIPRNVLLRLN